MNKRTSTNIAPRHRCWKLCQAPAVVPCSEQLQRRIYVCIHVFAVVVVVVAVAVVAAVDVFCFSTTLHQSESDCTPRRPSRPPTRPPLPLPRPRAALASWEFPPVCNASMSSCLGGWASTICPASRFCSLDIETRRANFFLCKV